MLDDLGDSSNSNVAGIIKAWIVTRPNYGQGPESRVRRTPLNIAGLADGKISLISAWEHNLVNADMLELVIQIYNLPGAQLSKAKLTGCFIFLGTQQRRVLFC